MAEQFDFDVEADQKAEAATRNRPVDYTEQRYNDTQGSGVGVTTDTPEQIAAAEQERMQPTVDQEPGQVSGADEVKYLKSQLGKQSAEVGELRQSNAVFQAKMEMLERQAQQSQQTQQQPVQNFDVFNGLPDEAQMMSPTERAAINNTFVNMATAFDGQLRAARAEAGYTAVRAASGITEVQERELTTAHPWVQNLAGEAKATALADLNKQRQQTAGTPQRAADEAARQVARQANFVETSTNVSSSDSESSMEPATNKLRRDIRAGKYKSAEDLRKALRKVGIGSVDEYGRSYG